MHFFFENAPRSASIQYSINHIIFLGCFISNSLLIHSSPIFQASIQQPQCARMEHERELVLKAENKWARAMSFRHDIFNQFNSAVISFILAFFTFSLVHVGYKMFNVRLDSFGNWCESNKQEVDACFFEFFFIVTTWTPLWEILFNIAILQVFRQLYLCTCLCHSERGTKFFHSLQFQVLNIGRIRIQCDKSVHSISPCKNRHYPSRIHPIALKLAQRP